MKISWPDTKITALTNIHIPVIQAPMAGGATTPELVAAVSNAGGLGSFAAGYLSPDEMRKAIKQIRLLTNKPFAVNLFIPEHHDATQVQIKTAAQIIQIACRELNVSIDSVKPPFTPSFEEQMQIILAEKIPVLSFTFGIPNAKWIQELKKAGVVLMGTATSVEEAVMLEKNSIDAIIAQGSEAGGHRGTFLGKAEDALTETVSLVSNIVKTINTPVIAAGGIMRAAEIFAAMKNGASAVQMGTAFLTCTESGIHPLYKKLLLTAQADATTLTRAFSGKLARGLVNKFIVRMRAHENAILDYPIQNQLTSKMRKAAAKQNLTDFMSLWAGQNFYRCQALPAAQLIQELNEAVMGFLSSL